MAKFFIRNSPEVIQDAIELSMQDFVRKYKPTTSTDEILSKAYLEIRAKHKPKEPQIEQPTEKKVTFKIIKSATGKTIHTKPVIAPIKEEEEEETPEVSHEQQVENDMLVAANDRDNQLINAARGRDKSGINEDEIIVGVDIAKPGGDVTVESVFKDGKIISSSIVTDDTFKNVARGFANILDNTDESKLKVEKSRRGRKSSCDSEKRDARILELLKAGNKGTEIVKIMKEEGYSVFAPQVSNIKAINDL